MAKSRRPRGATTNALPNQSVNMQPNQPLDQAETNDEKNMVSIIDFMTVRRVLVVFVIFEMALFLWLFPRYQIQRYSHYAKTAYQNHDYEKAYNNLKKLNDGYALQKDNRKRSWIVRYWNSYWKKNPRYRSEYLYQGSRCLVKLGRFEEAQKLLKQVSPGSYKKTKIKHHPGVKDLIGVTFLHTEQEEKGLRILLSALRIKNSEKSMVFYQLGRDLYQNPWNLHYADLLKSSNIVHQLVTGTTPLDTYLRKRILKSLATSKIPLEEELHKLLTTADDLKKIKVSSALREELIDELNAIVKGENIWQAELIKELKLPLELAALKKKVDQAKERKSADQQALNRKLLEVAFAGMIRSGQAHYFEASQYLNKSCDDKMYGEESQKMLMNIEQLLFGTKTALPALEKVKDEE